MSTLTNALFRELRAIIKSAIRSEATAQAKRALKQLSGSVEEYFGPEARDRRKAAAFEREMEKRIADLAAKGAAKKSARKSKASNRRSASGSPKRKGAMTPRSLPSQKKRSNGIPPSKGS